MTKERKAKHARASKSEEPRVEAALDGEPTEDLRPPEETEEDAAGLRLALNRPIPLGEVRTEAEQRRLRIASETTHVGPPGPTSSSD